MKQTLTHAAMLALWRQIRAVEPLRLDCTVGRTDGPDIDAALARDMRAWYLNLLDSGPLQHLAPIDMASQTQLRQGADGIVSLTLPGEVRRVLQVKFAGWSEPLEPEKSGQPLAANPFCHRPRVVTKSPHSLAVQGAEGVLESVICAVDLGPQTYAFDDSALNFKEI